MPSKKARRKARERQERTSIEDDFEVVEPYPHLKEVFANASTQTEEDYTTILLDKPTAAETAALAPSCAIM